MEDLRPKKYAVFLDLSDEIMIRYICDFDWKYKYYWWNIFKGMTIEKWKLLLPNDIRNWFHGKISLDRKLYISYLVVTCIPNEQSVIKSSIFMSNGGSNMSIPELIDEGLKVTLFRAGFSIYIIIIGANRG